jgi:hypothetical protein
MSGHDACRTMTHLPIEGMARARIRMGLYGKVRQVGHASWFNGWLSRRHASAEIAEAVIDALDEIEARLDRAVTLER